MGHIATHMPASPKISLHHGDCRDVLRTIPSDSLDSCVTDPPYALVSVVKRFGGANAKPPKDYGPGNGLAAYARSARGFMGKTWDTGETAFSTEFWQEVYRVLKPGAFVAAFGASRGYHRMACAIEDAGFEIRDSLMWVYGTGFPKSHSVSLAIDKQVGAIGHLAKSFNTKGAGDRAEEFAANGRDFSIRHEPATDAAREWNGFNVALKPAFEPIVLARKPLSEGTVAANVLRWRTGALNIDASRVPATDKTPAPVGQYGGSSIGPNGHSGVRDGSADSLGRWPANLVTDGSDEVIGAFPYTKGPGSAAKPTSVGTGDGVTYMTQKPQGTIYPGDSGSAARFFYSAKASKQDRAGSKHPTVKPISLMEWLATLITPPGGTVLDPFAGSGTTGAACRNKGFICILIEREDEYVADIRRRLDLPGAVPLDASAPVSAGRRIYGIFADEKGVAGGRLDTSDSLDAAIARYLRQKRALAGLAA